MNQYSQFNDLSCYAEFIIKRYIYNLDTLDILNNCKNIRYYNDCYYLWTDDGYVTVFDKDGNKIDKPDIKAITNSIISKNIKKCIIPDSVTKICSSSFAYCYSLKSITIPDSVTEIGKDAFFNCKSLKSITIPDSVKKICYAFCGCESLKSIAIPNSVTEISCYTFANCKSLETITIPDSVTKIGDYAFAYCYSLKSITIPKRFKDKLTTIDIDEYNPNLNLKIQYV